MNEQILFDRLRYMDKLKSAGIPEDQARAHADAMDDALRESVATKTDLKTEIMRIENVIAVAVRDLKIWVGSVAAILFACLAAIKFFG